MKKTFYALLLFGFSLCLATGAGPNVVKDAKMTGAADFSALTNKSTVRSDIGGVAIGKTLFVDQVNGSDATGTRARKDLPFLTLSSATAVAASGDVILLGPGTWTVTTLKLPNGVSLIGSGVDVTKIESASTITNGAIVCPGNNSIVRDLTITGTASDYQIPLGIAGAQSAFTGAVAINVKVVADTDGIYLSGAASSLIAINCILSTKFDAVNVATGGTLDLYNPIITVAGPSSQNGGIYARGVATSGGTVHIYGGTVTVNGATDTNSAFENGAATTGALEASNVRVSVGASATNNFTTNNTSSAGTVAISNITRSDGLALSCAGPVTRLNPVASKLPDVLSTPATPTVSRIGGGGVTTWSYRIVAVEASGRTTAAGSTGSLTSGFATLNVSHNALVRWTVVPNAVSYDVYRTAVGSSPTTTGKIGNVTTAQLLDDGLAGDSSTPPSVNQTGWIAAASAAFSSPLPVSSGGTGKAAFTAYAPVFGGTTSTSLLQSGTAGTSGQVLTSNGAGALPTFQAGGISDGDKGDVTVSGSGTVFILDGGTDPLILYPSSAMGALVIDVTKQNNTKSISADSTFTLSTTPSSGTRFGLKLTNSDTAAHTMTLWSGMVKSDSRNGATITTFSIPASTTVTLTAEYEGSSIYRLYGEPLNNNSLTTATAATGDYVSGYDASAGTDAKFLLPIVGTDVQAYDADLTTWAGIAPGTGVGTALATNVGSVGAFVTLNGAGGTPSTITLTNGTGLPLTTGVTGTLPVANGGTGITAFGTGVATFLGTPSVANLKTALSDETTVVGNLLSLANPSAISFIKIAADNTVSTRTPAQVLSDIGAQASITTGTTSQYLKGDLSLGTLNQAAVAGLTTADSPVFTGLSTTPLDATKLTGTVADARLSANVPLLNAANAFTAAQSITTSNVLAQTNTVTGLGTTVLPALLVTNTTAAAAGAQQVSPSVRWTGQGWKTTATAASQAVDFRAYVLPVQGPTNPTGTWTLESSVNGGAFGLGMTLDTLGTLRVPTSIILTANSAGQYLLATKTNGNTAGVIGLDNGNNINIGRGGAENPGNISIGGSGARVTDSSFATVYAAINSLGVEVGSGLGYGFSSTSGGTGTIDAQINRNAANVLEVNTGTVISGTSNAASIKALTFIPAGTATTCTGATIGTGSKSNAGFVTATTTGTSTIVVTFPVTAPTGWNISASDSTAITNMVQTASTTTTATLSGTTVSGDVIRYIAMPY